MRVVIADDAVLLRQGLARLLAENGVEVCGEAGDGEQLLALVDEHEPDVAIVDIRMPPMKTDEGLVAARRIRKEFPATGVLVLSQYVEASYALQLLNHADGHCGYLIKDRVLDAAELVAALERIAAGEVVVDTELVRELFERRRERDPLETLTDREREVLRLMAEGLTDRGIAERLWVAPSTVETHVRHILRKLGLHEDAAYNRRVKAVITQLRS